MGIPGVDSTGIRRVGENERCMGAGLENAKREERQEEDMVYNSYKRFHILFIITGTLSHSHFVLHN